MNKFFKFILLLILSFLIIFYSKDISNSIISVFDTWKYSVFPSLFPFLIISKIFMNYGFNFKLFNVNPNYSFVFFMSLISGFPSSSKYIKELVDNDVISLEEGNNLILFTHFASPAFILVTLCSNFLNNPSCGFLILFSHYIGNLIILFFIDFKKYNVKKYSISPKSFSNVLGDSIRDTLNTLFLILGTLVTYSIVVTFINKLPISLYYKSILSGLIELTSGLKNVSLLDISLKIKVSICSFLLSFGGFAIHTQVISILKINYKRYFIFRIFHGFLSFLISYFLFNLIYHL